MRPLLHGRACIAFVAGINDPGYRCDSKGTLYYKAPDVALTAPMTKEQIQAALSKLLSQYARRSIASCLLASEDNDEAVVCLKKEKQRLTGIFDDCMKTKFNVSNDALLLRAVDHCIEYKSKL